MIRSSIEGSSPAARSRPRTISWLVAPVLIALLLPALACDGRHDDPAPTVEVPLPDTTEMETQVRDRLRETRQAVLLDSGSASAWGRFGMVCHAHDLWEEAAIAYRAAASLDPDDVRWHYFLGDVLSVVGTDLEGAESAFRRAIELRRNYAPAHMRLGNVLVAADRSSDAAAEFERALELEPDLDQARVPLAQLHLARGDLDSAATLLEQTLDKSPRHGQALSTLAQVYNRQGRPEQAREVAGRARDAASYNLFDDPLMSAVVAEGVSAVQIWERAKSFLEAGNNEQAILGLRRVVTLQPENADAHQQLAVAYGNVGNVGRAEAHLERTIEIEPASISARIQLAMLQLDQRRPEEAVPHLRHVAELAPDDPDAGWLLGRALMLSGDAVTAVEVFERRAKTGADAPVWAHNDWGRALVELGEPESGLDHFRTSLSLEPENAQAHFYAGLVLEGLGKVDDAARSYCASLQADPVSPAGGRLAELGKSCHQPPS